MFSVVVFLISIIKLTRGPGNALNRHLLQTADKKKKRGEKHFEV